MFNRENPTDDFERNEIIGRDILTKILKEKFHATDMYDGSKYDQVDYYASINGKQYGFEIKTRNKLYTDMCLEELKWNGMLTVKEQKGLDEVYYVNIVNDTVYFWSSETIKKYGSKPYVIGMPKTTCDLSNHKFVGKRVLGLGIIYADFKYSIQ